MYRIMSGCRLVGHNNCRDSAEYHQQREERIGFFRKRVEINRRVPVNAQSFSMLKFPHRRRHRTSSHEKCCSCKYYCANLHVFIARMCRRRCVLSLFFFLVLFEKAISEQSNDRDAAQKPSAIRKGLYRNQ